ncbi:hypothetical protein FBU59_005243 [Linderina macrospora]|uniref:Uncharacterized protein n=1 Tax=Linderina macrospora TaxID=4868 RepID=A0ACC1J3B6_9FUNG|nr:hypothetical protein FBU59_005243 [Linderina macrospora]
MLEELYAKRDKSDTINLELLIGDEVISSEEDVPSEEAVPEGAGAQNPDVPMEETKPKDDSPKDETAKGMSKEDPPKGDAPKDDQSKDDTPKEDKPKGDTPKDDPPKDEPTKNDPPKDDPPKDDPPKDDPPKDGSPTDTPPATCGPSAPEPPKCDDIILAPCNNTGDLESLIQKYMASVQITSEPPKPPPVCKATIHVSAGPPCMMQASPLPPRNCFSAMRIVHPSCSYVDGISISASYTPPEGARVAYSNANVISYQYTHHPPYEPCERGWVFHHGY